MNDDQLLRYSRHILLEEIGVEGQERLLAAHALVIGAGGLGSPVALYLGTAGVGHITLVDHDTVDLTNLQRQLAHTLARLGMPKAESARQAIAAINPERGRRCRSAPTRRRSMSGCRQADVVIDCCDNFATRHAVNAACVKHGRPLVSGAAIRFDGQITVYDTRDEKSPCYACLFPPEEYSRRPAAPPWACSRRWSASSAPCKPPKLSSSSAAPAIAGRTVADAGRPRWNGTKCGCRETRIAPCARGR